MILSALAMGVVWSGCHTQESRVKQQEEVIQESEELNIAYLEGDLGHARDAMQNNARLLEKASVLEPIGRAQLLSFTYFRLYVLETRAGNKAAAAAHLLKAQYWSLKNAELSGVGVQQAMEQIRQFDPVRIIEYVDGRDKRVNKGNEPAYLEVVRGTNDVPQK